MAFTFIAWICVITGESHIDSYMVARPCEIKVLVKLLPILHQGTSIWGLAISSGAGLGQGWPKQPALVSEAPFLCPCVRRTQGIT